MPGLDALSASLHVTRVGARTAGPAPVAHPRADCNVPRRGPPRLHVATGGLARIAGGAIYWLSEGVLTLDCGSGGGGSPPSGGPDDAAALEGAATPAVEAAASGCTAWVGNAVGERGYGPVLASSAFYQHPYLPSADEVRCAPGRASRVWMRCRRRVCKRSTAYDGRRHAAGLSTHMQGRHAQTPRVGHRVRRDDTGRAVASPGCRPGRRVAPSLLLLLYVAMANVPEKLARCNPLPHTHAAGCKCHCRVGSGGGGAAGPRRRVTPAAAPTATVREWRGDTAGHEAG